MKKVGTQWDLIKASRAASRLEEMELLGPGFHSKDTAHRNKKVYNRKSKHKQEWN